MLPDARRVSSSLTRVKSSTVTSPPVAAAFSEALHTSIFEKKAIRYDGYKLIYDIEHETVELYNVQVDPYEQVNLVDQKPEIVKTMLADLKAWMVQSARTATELPRQRPIVQTLDDEMRQRLRDAGY